jgi:ketosteroid isomerase-like protein
MSAAENVETVKRGYAAFVAGDGAAAMADMADDIEWVTPGNSAISGTTHGKQELGATWAKLAEKGFEVTPQHFIADDERVVVLAQNKVAGETADVVDVFTLNADGKVIKVQVASDTAMLERVWGPK